MSDGVDLTKALEQLLPGSDWRSKPETIARLLDECRPHTPQQVAERLDVELKPTGRMHSGTSG